MPALIACALLLWVPGAVVLVALRLPLRWAAVLAPALSAGLVGAGALLPLAWGLPAAGVVLTAAVVLATALRGRRAAAQALPAGPRAPVLLAGTGVALAAVVLVLAVTRTGAGLGSPNQLWDAAWHANLTTWVLDTGDAAPSAAGDLLGAGWREVDSAYPTGLHAVAALVVRAAASVGSAGAVGSASPAVAALHAVVLLHAAVVLPAAVAAVVREVGLRSGADVGGGRGTTALGVGAGVGAVVAVLADVFPLGHLWRPAWPMTVGFTLAVVTAAAALRCARAHQEGALPLRVAVLVPVACLAGATAVHPSAGVAVGVGAAAWAVGWAAAPGARRRTRTAAVALVLGLVLAGAWVVSRHVPAAVSLFSYDYRSSTSPWAAAGRVLALGLPGAPAPADDGAALQAGVAVAVLAALVVVLATEGARWLALLWLLLLAAAVDTIAPTAPGLRLVTGWFFSGQSRLVSLVAVVGAVLVGVAVTRAVPWLARRRWTAVLAVVAGTAALTATAADAGRRAEPHLAIAYADRVAGPDQERVMAALAALPLPAGGRVLGDPVDGSPWLYAVTGTLPLFTHYDARRPDGAAALLLQRVDAVDTDPAVRAALAELRVCYVYRNDKIVTRRQQHAPGFAGLDDAASLRLVARAGAASAYRVEPPVPGC